MTKLQILQSYRSEAYDSNNVRLADAITVAIAELIGCSDKAINNDIRRYQKSRKIEPRK